MFSFFKKSSKKDIKLICFDIDNTLCDFASAETITEAYLMELISTDITNIQKHLQLKSPSDHKRNKRIDINIERAIENPCSPFMIMKIFNDIKSFHMRNGEKPEKYSRALWFRETLERLDEDTALGISVNTLIKKCEIYEKKYWDSIIKNIKNYPNTISTLNYLKAKNFKLATITDSDGKKDIKMIRLASIGLDKYFDYIITTDDTGLTKPAEINWANLLEISGLKAEQCIMVGDHPEIDLITAKKLGFITIWTKERLNTDLSQKYVDYEIHNIKEIIDIVEKLT